MSMNTPIGNITQTTPIKDFKELDEMQNEQYLLGIDNNAVGNGSKISLENLINSSISADSDNLITKGTDDRLLVNTPVEIGDLSDLTTTNKSTLVAAINEVDSDIETEVTNRVNAVSGEATTRANADNNLQSQIDAITAASDVTDIVGTYAELQAYDTTGLPDNSVIKVLQDESRQNETTYYRWVITGGVGAWVLIGEEGPYYTISQADSKFATQEAVGNLNNLATSDKSSVVNAMNELASVLDPTQTADYIKNSKAIYSGEVSENAIILPQIKEMAHSTFDLSKFAVVGSPIITDDGIASGFSGSNYLHTIIVDYSKPWEIKFRAKFNSNYSNAGNAILNFFGHNDYPNSLNIERINSLIPVIDVGFTITEGASSRDFSIRSVGIEYDTYYDVAVGWTGAEYYLKHKLVSDNIYTEATPYVSSSHIIGSTHISSNPSLRTLDIGMTDYSHYFNGSIDLKQFSITVDGVEVFSGNKTGIDTIKPDDYTVVGTPTISADGVASGFSDSNYLYTLTVTSGGNEWEIQSLIFPVANTLTDKHQNIVSAFNSSSNLKFYISATMNGKSLVARFFDLSSGTDLVFTTIVNVLLLERWNLVKAKYKNNALTFYVNNIVVGNPVSVNLDDFLTGCYFTLGSNSNLHVFYGSIDLNSFKIYVDGNLVYQPCLKIPYTESKTGSKIADIQYRDRINDMYEQFGYAPYYTLSDTDFTLPQGELYGYLEKRARDIAHPVGVPFYRFSDEINEDEVRLEGAEVDKGLYLAIEQKLSALCTAGSTEDKICLPDFRNRVAWGASDFGYVEAGLPNITGYVEKILSNTLSDGSASGAFTKTRTGYGANYNGSGDGSENTLDFNASRSNLIYGNSTTVQPPAVKVRWLARWK